MNNIMALIQREFIYIWYYFEIQLRQIFWYWIIGMAIGSLISVFAKDRIHGAFAKLRGKKLGLLGIIPACILGILSPLCMYGTIPIAASFRKQGMREDWLAAFMITGPATKITNLGALKIAIGWKCFLLYILFVMLFSFTSGLIVNIFI